MGFKCYLNSRVFPGPTLMNVGKVVDGVLSIKCLHCKIIDILTLLTLDTISSDQKFECTINIQSPSSPQLRIRETSSVLCVKHI